jgi:transitional endoplasmic reticulum ATPase
MAVPYEDIGGLKPQLHRIREMIELPLRYPEVFERLGIDAPKGVLLHGPPGCGKTLIARAIAHETEANFFAVSGPEIIHKFYGESEAHLRKIFEEATRQGPSIIFLDEIDAIAPRREQVVGEVEKRVVAQLLALMDGLNKRQNVIVIGATNIPNALDPALRRPGRFDREISIPIPDRRGRLDILEIHSRGMPLKPDVDMDRLAEITHGFVGADLEALCREAAMICLRDILADLDFSLAKIPYERLAKLEVRMDHFLSALREVEPSAIREVFVEVPNVRWSDVGGLARLKQRLLEAVEWPLRYATLYEQAGVRPPKGILLSGPPGCGKTLLAKAIATESQVNFISVKGPALLSKYVGESERQVRDIFRKARQAAPCIIFFDELDALMPARGGAVSDTPVTDRVLSQFLAELDGIEELKGVLVLGATNRLDRLDPAVLRPGRFDEVVEIPPSEEPERREIFEVHLRGKPVAQDVKISDLAAQSAGFTGAQIASVCNLAALRAVRRAVGLAGGSDTGKPPLATQAKALIVADDLAAALAEISPKP